MCGRYTLSTPVPILAERFGLPTMPDLRPRYNVASTQQVACVREDADGDRQLPLYSWGLVPSWAKDLSIGTKLINPRTDTVAEKPSFRSALKSRRCLVLADGFFEWQPAGGKKQPWLFRMRDREPFAFAGLWERWKGADGEPLESCCLITTDANDVVRSVHDRMPVILPAGDYERWLDPGVKSADVLVPLLKPYPASAMTATAVSMRVNNARFDDPSCLDEVDVAWPPLPPPFCAGSRR